MAVRKDRWWGQQVQRHRGMKNTGSLEPLQGVRFGQRARKMWVEEAGDRGGGQAGKGLGCWSCSLGFTQWDQHILAASCRGYQLGFLNLSPGSTTYQLCMSPRANSLPSPCLNFFICEWE